MSRFTLLSARPPDAPEMLSGGAIFIVFSSKRGATKHSIGRILTVFLASP